MVQSERATWLELSGIPLNCWNQCTFKRVAELWGTFEALGENAFHSKDCEKMTILITTRQAIKIDEVVEVEVGNLLYEVKVVEIGFSDNSLELQAAGVKVSGSEVEESSSEPSDADVRRKKLISQDNSINGDEGFFDVAAREINHLMLLCIEKKNVKKTNY
ncbi:hypothetical protein V6N13_029158 [Hibiscus sabdariffa]